MALRDWALRDWATRVSTVCLVVFSVQHFYDDLGRIKAVESRAIEKYVAETVKKEFKHQK